MTRPAAGPGDTPVPSRLVSVREWYALGFGLFLGLCLWKFGNPVILDREIAAPRSPREWWIYPWPTHWSFLVLPPLALAGAALAFAFRSRWPTTRWLWVLPLVWLGWQLVAATRTVDAGLTAMALGEFAGCVVCYFAGALVLRGRRALAWLLPGLLAALALCLVKAVNQRLVEFPAEHRLLIQGEQTGWTNFPPNVLREMMRDQVIITTNGATLANPLILAKVAKGRVNGTLVYPNALAGVALLLCPLAITLAFRGTRRFRKTTRRAVIALTLFLALGGLFWSGSKYGWLLALALLGLWLFRLRWPKRWKFTVLAAALVLGLAVFAVRFHHYFARGATSVNARFDYWRAALEVTEASPWVGSGPGTFQRPYAELKSPRAEMARLAHNDYLEQFSDSGVIGGASYAAWIALALALAGQRAWRAGEPLALAVLFGLLGWFTQGLAEFSLYIPALAWTAFLLLGWLVAAGSTAEGSGNASTISRSGIGH